MLGSVFAEPSYTPDGRMGTSCSPYRTHAVNPELCTVILPQLVITPERYHKKKVRVIAQFVAKFEVVGLVVDSSSVWLSLSRDEFEKYKKYDGSRVIVEGEFDALSFGHMSQWGGTIKNVTRLQKM